MRIELTHAVIRSWRSDDAETIAVHANDRDVSINLRDLFPHPYTVADAEEWIRFACEADPETHFAVEVGGEAAGGIGYKLGQDVERTGAELGAWLGKKYWGRGIMTEALVAIRDHALDTHGLTRVWGVPFDHNAASVRILEKADFEFEGRLRRSVIKNGEIFDQLMYAYVR